MVLDPRKRQKKLERRKAKDKQRKKALAIRNADDARSQLARYASAPVLHACYTDSLWQKGIAQVLLSRQLTNGSVAFAAFLVDVYCLGVKNAMSGVVTRQRYREEILFKLRREHEFVHRSPEWIRKLVEDSVEYAGRFGLTPHPDYFMAKEIFGDIDASACTEEFKFGQNGKPYYIAGPFESPARSQEIVRLLSEHCGDGRFDYVVHLPLEELAELEGLRLVRFGDESAERHEP